MQIDRKKNAIRNMAAGLVNRMFVMVVPVIIRSLMINHMGELYLGANNLFSTIIQVLSMSELGISSAIVQSMYKPIAKSDKDTLCSLLDYYRKCYIVIGCVIMTAGMIVMPFLPHLIKGTPPEGINLYALYIIYLLNSVVSYFAFAYRGSLLSAFQREDIVSNVDTVIVVAKGILQIGAILITNNVYVYAIVQPVLTIAANIIRAIITKKIYPDIIPKGKLEKSIKKEITTKIKGLFVNKICAVSRNTLDNLYISKMFGLADVAYYGNYYFVLYAVNILLNTINASVTAGIGNSVASESKEKNYRDFVKFNGIYMILSIWCCVFMMVLYQPFIAIFYGENCLYNISMPIAFCAYLFSLCMGSVLYIYANCEGLWYHFQVISILEVIGNVILNYVFGKLFGIVGIVCATIVTIWLFNFAMGARITFKKYFDRSPGRYYGTQILFALLGIVLVSLCYFFANIFAIENILLMLCYKIAVCAIVPAGCFFVLFRKSAGYAFCIDLIKKIIRR